MPWLLRPRSIDAIALLLMLSSVGLLITPSAFHRIVDRGDSTGRTLGVTSLCAAASLLPFAAALGIDLALALMRTVQIAVFSIVAGAGFALMGVAAWYGLGWIMRNNQGAAERHQAELGSRRDGDRTVAYQDRANADGSSGDPAGRTSSAWVPTRDRADRHVREAAKPATTAPCCGADVCGALGCAADHPCGTTPDRLGRRRHRGGLGDRRTGHDPRAFTTRDGDGW